MSHVRNTVASRGDFEELQRENDRLRNEKRVLIQQREEHNELVQYVKGELSYREKGLLTRTRWWLFGKGT